MDQLNLMFSIDTKMADYWEVFAPEYNCFLMDSPMEVSGNVALPKPILTTGGAWLDDDK